jgi:hypothetical protein
MGRHLLCLKRVRKRHITRQLTAVAAAGDLQRPRVVTDDMKDPERVCRAHEVARQPVVACRKERDDARDVRAQVRFRECPAIDMANDHDARFHIDHFGRQASRMGGDARCSLAIAEDVVSRNIAAATCDIALASVIDDESRVGKTSAQRFELHLVAPAWQRGYSCFEIDGHHPKLKITPEYRAPGRLPPQSPSQRAQSLKTYSPKQRAQPMEYISHVWGTKYG